MAPTARIESALTLHHRPSMGDESAPVSFERGALVEVMQRFADRVLIKDDAGRLFTLAADAISEDIPEEEKALG